MQRLPFLSALASVLLLAWGLQSASAQPTTPAWTATPTYGTVTLSSGFTPDPSVHDIRAGGSDRAAQAGCSGYIHADAPDLDLKYEADATWGLQIDATADIDVTLMVHTPGGAWVCDDDTGNGLNARLSFDRPESGYYSIWVGTYSDPEGDLPDARLAFSEYRMEGSDDATDALNWLARPTYGTTTLNAGFLPDPNTTRMSMGGATENPLSGNGCVGHVNSAAPDLDLNYEAGFSSLYIYTAADVDATLIVYTPDGEWLCDDDGGEGNGALLSFEDPPSGNYNIWVGTYYESDAGSTGLLHISEIRP